MLLNMEIDKVAYSAYEANEILRDILKLGNFLEYYQDAEVGDMRSSEIAFVKLLKITNPLDYKTAKSFISKFKKFLKPDPYLPIITEDILKHLYDSAVYGMKHSFDTDEYMENITIPSDIEYSVFTKLAELYTQKPETEDECVSELTHFVITGLKYIRLGKFEEFISKHI